MTGHRRQRPGRAPAASGFFSAVLRFEMSSANLAIGTASAFVLVTAAASLAVDRDAAARPSGQSWGLRGSLTRIDMRDAPAPAAAGPGEPAHQTKLARL